MPIRIEIRSQEAFGRPQGQPHSPSMTSTLLDLAAIAGQESRRLCCVDLHQQVTVVGVEGEDALAERLRSAGLWEGVVVELVGSSIFGDPLLVELHGFRLALRKNEAQRVTVSSTGEGLERSA